MHRIRIPRALRGLGLGLAAALVLAAPRPARPAEAPRPAPIRIGVILPLTGGSSDFGNSARLGIEMAVREINALGGYMGRPFELLKRDDHASPDDGRAAALDLLDREKVDFTIGFCNSGVALKALDLFEARRSVLMVPCATGTQLTHRTPAVSSYVFRTAPTDEMMARFLAGNIVERRRLRKVAVLADQTGYGEGGLRDLTAELARLGLQPVHVARFALGVQSLAGPMQAARDAGAEAVVVYAVGPEQAVAVKARNELHWKVPYFAPWPLSFRRVLDDAGPAHLEGTMMAQTVINDVANERRAAFALHYAKLSDEARVGSFMAAAQAYDATYLMLRGLFTSHGDTSGPALKAALENLDAPHRGVVSTYHQPFSAGDHDAFSVNMLWLGVWRGGQVQFAYPDDARLSSVFRRKDQAPVFAGAP